MSVNNSMQESSLTKEMGRYFVLLLEESIGKRVFFKGFKLSYNMILN